MEQEIEKAAQLYIEKWWPRAKPGDKTVARLGFKAGATWMKEHVENVPKSEVEVFINGEKAPYVEDANTYKL